MRYSIGLRASQLRWNVNCCGCLRYSVHRSKHRLTLLSEGNVRGFQIGRTWRIPRQSIGNRLWIHYDWLIRSTAFWVFSIDPYFIRGNQEIPFSRRPRSFFIPPAPAKYGILWSTGTGLSPSVWNRPSDHRAQEREELDGTKWLCYHDEEYRMDQEISDQGHGIFSEARLLRTHLRHLCLWSFVA